MPANLLPVCRGRDHPRCAIGPSTIAARGDTRRRTARPHPAGYERSTSEACAAGGLGRVPEPSAHRRRRSGRGGRALAGRCLAQCPADRTRQPAGERWLELDGGRFAVAPRRRRRLGRAADDQRHGHAALCRDARRRDRVRQLLRAQRAGDLPAAGSDPRLADGRAADGGRRHDRDRGAGDARLWPDRPRTDPRRGDAAVQDRAARHTQPVRPSLPLPSRRGVIPSVPTTAGKAAAREDGRGIQHAHRLAR